MTHESHRPDHRSCQACGFSRRHDRLVASYAMTEPKVVVFDVNETLSNMEPMARRFVEIGVPEWTAKLWFANLLRDGFALTAAGSSSPFAEIAEGSLRTVLTGSTLSCDLDSAVDRILSAFMDLDVHPDVVDGVTALSELGFRLVTLTNGSTAVPDRLLSVAGIRGRFEQLLSVEDAGEWKPAPGSYHFAARSCGVKPEQMLLVAVHPWDIDGATRVGLRTAWINRSGSPYPPYFRPPDHAVATLTSLSDHVT
jgi:2-haloacid dehalogenase